MMFIDDDEFILLMLHNADSRVYHYAINVLTVDERKCMRDVGIKTAVEYPQWNVTEPRKGEYNFSGIETILASNRAAGLKTIMSGYNYILPSWIPNDWHVMFKGGGHTKEILSFWHPDAQAKADEYYSMLVKTFSADDVMFVLSEYLTGESALHNTACFYDPFATASYRAFVGSDALPDIETPETKEWLRKHVIEHFVRRQEILRPWHNEVWDSMQWLISLQSQANGNYAQKDVLLKYRELWPDVEIVLMQYTYFAHGQKYFDFVDDLAASTGAKVIVEAQYCEGLKATTPETIRKGFRGQILAPTHPFTGHTSIEPWMLDTIRQSMKLYRDSIDTR